jgi:hypothetical protein
MPEETIKYRIRRFTPEGLAVNAFGCRSMAELTKIVSSSQVKQSPASDLAIGYPTVVM